MRPRPPGRTGRSRPSDCRDPGSTSSNSPRPSRRSRRCRVDDAAVAALAEVGTHSMSFTLDSRRRVRIVSRTGGVVVYNPCPRVAWRGRVTSSCRPFVPADPRSRRGQHRRAPFRREVLARHGIEYDDFDRRYFDEPTATGFGGYHADGNGARARGTSPRRPGASPRFPGSEACSTSAGQGVHGRGAASLGIEPGGSTSAPMPSLAEQRTGRGSRCARCATWAKERYDLSSLRRARLPRLSEIGCPRGAAPRHADRRGLLGPALDSRSRSTRDAIRSRRPVAQAGAAARRPGGALPRPGSSAGGGGGIGAVRPGARRDRPVLTGSARRQCPYGSSFSRNARRVRSRNDRNRASPGVLACSSRTSRSPVGCAPSRAPVLGRFLDLDVRDHAAVSRSQPCWAPTQTRLGQEAAVHEQLVQADADHAAPRSACRSPGPASRAGSRPGRCRRRIRRTRSSAPRRGR